MFKFKEPLGCKHLEDVTRLFSIFHLILKFGLHDQLDDSYLTTFSFLLGGLDIFYENIFSILIQKLQQKRETKIMLIKQENGTLFS